MRKGIDFIRRWGLSCFAVIIGGICILVMLITFDASTNDSMERFIHDNMEEMNQAAILSLQYGFTSLVEPLQLQADLFNKMDNPNDEQIMSTLMQFAEENNLKNVAIVTFDGKVYSSARGVADIQKNDKLPNLLKRETVVSQPRIFEDGTLVIDISTPVLINSSKVGKLVISIDNDYISRMFSDNILKGDAALNLMTQDGMVIARISRRFSPLAPNTNIFDFYNQEEIEFVMGSPAILADVMRNNQSAWVEYNFMGSKVCSLFMPFGQNNWYMAIAATDSTLNTQAGIIQENALKLSCGIMLIVILGSFIVVTQRVKEQKRIDALKNTYSIAIKKTNDLFYEADIDNDLFIDYSEQKDKAIWKETPKNYSNALVQIADACTPECKQQLLDNLLPQNIKIKMKEGLSSINFEYKITTDHDTIRWISAMFVPVDDGTGRTKLICMENDITEEILKQENLKKSATLDGLTGIYNRETTKTYINWFLRNEGLGGEHALALVDIDYFKEVNDQLGHIKGDQVLTEIAKMLKTVFRKTDIVGRVGGDEFIVLMKDFGVIELVMAKMKSVLESSDRIYRLEGEEQAVKISASIGIALFEKDGFDFDQLYHSADCAMYESKRQGRGRYTFYSKDLKEVDDRIRGENTDGDQ